MSFEFQFDAPKWFDFSLQTQPLPFITSVNIEDKNDIWFTNGHFCQTPQKVSSQELKKKQIIEFPPLRRSLRCIQQKKEQKQQQKLKIPTSKSNQIRKQKKSLLQNQKGDKKHLQKVIQKQENISSINTRLPPCPFPPRIQRKWQSKSKKTWYSLSVGSIKKAQQEMNLLSHQEIQNIRHIKKNQSQPKMVSVTRSKSNKQLQTTFYNKNRFKF